MNFVDAQMGRRMASRTVQEFNENIQVNSSEAEWIDMAEKLAGCVSCESLSAVHACLLRFTEQKWAHCACII